MAESFAPHHDEILAVIAASRNYNGWLFERARPHLGARVLDAGAGVGTFTELVAETGAHVVAVEPQREFVHLLRERFSGRANVEVVEGTAEALAGEGGFDSIVCFNVLEHVHDDERALAALREQLRPAGRLLLLVPAHGFLFGPTDRAIGHERRYDRAPLRRLLEGAGYSVETLRHVNPVGALGWLVRVRLLGREEWPAGSFRLFDRLVPLLRPLDRLSLPLGLSLWAVASRPV